VLDHEIYGLTSPLLTTSDGKKMGKSMSGAIWLNPDMLSPYEFWQFWRNTTDADVGRFLKLYTELPIEECDRLGALESAEINDAKITLANEVTALLHGRDAADAAAQTAKEVFEKGGVGDDLPTLTLDAGDVSDGISIVQLIVKSGLAGSGKEAKRLISEGGAKMNDEALSDAGRAINAALGKPRVNGAMVPLQQSPAFARALTAYGSDVLSVDPVILQRRIAPFGRITFASRAKVADIKDTPVRIINGETQPQWRTAV